MKELKASLLALLAKREYTVHQLREKSVQKFPDLEPSDVEEVLQWLQDKNYLSDNRFMEHFIRQAHRKGDGPLKMKQMLQQKGVGRDEVKAYLTSIHDPELQYRVAKKEAQKKYSILSHKEPNKLQQRLKLSRFLAGRGFEYGVVQRVVEELV